MKWWGILAAAFVSFAMPAVAQDKNITVIYIGGWDCGPCIKWKQDEKPAFLKSPQYAKVNYVEVDSPKLKEAYQEKYWPEKYRPVLQQIPKKFGTPRFLVVKDGEIIYNGWEGKPWTGAWAKIKEVAL